GTIEATLAASDCFRRDVLILSGDAVVACRFAAEDDVGIERIGGYVAVLFGADRMKFTERDCSIVAAACDCSGAAFLLAAVNLIREAVVGRDVIECRGGLVVPRAPGLSAVDAYGRALIDGEKQDLGMQRVDPDCVVVVAAGCALDRGKGRAAVHRTVGGRVADVDLIGVARIGAHPCEIVAAAPDAFLVIDARPALTGVVRAIQTTDIGFSVDERVQAIVVARRDGKADASEALRACRKSARQLMPRGSPVGGFEQAATVAIVGIADSPWWAPRCPQAGVDDLRIDWIEREVDTAGVFILVENLGPVLAAVSGAEDSAFGVGSVRVTEHCREHAVGIGRINNY